MFDDKASGFDDKASGILFCRRVSGSLRDSIELALFLGELKQPMPALTENRGGSMAEAASVCLADRGHQTPVSMVVSRRAERDERRRYMVHFLPVTGDMLRAHSDLQEATEHGSYGMAILLLKQMEGYSVVARARKATGIDYRINFLGLLRNIAPDGASIKQVGFTASRQGVEKSVALTRSRASISLTPDLSEQPALPASDLPRVRVSGRLFVASKKRETSPMIEIIEERLASIKPDPHKPATHRVAVPPGMMDDIVKPLWGERVRVTGLQRAGIIYLDDIQKLGEEER